MSELSSIHFLKITGLVNRQKKNEFENTVKFACTLMSPAYIEKSLSEELLFGDNYYFFICWSTEKELRMFIQSEEYQLIRAAYDVMGVLEKIEIGFHAEIKTILINH